MNKIIPQMTINLCRSVGITPARLLTREDISQIYPSSAIVSPALWQLIQSAQHETRKHEIRPTGARRFPVSASRHITMATTR